MSDPHFLFIRHIGHGGGGWLMVCCNNHPAGISLIGECHKKTQLDFVARGIPMTQEAKNAQIQKLFEDRIHFGDCAMGVIKSFNESSVKWARKLVGKENVHVISMVRNPMLRFFTKWRKRVRDATIWYNREFNANYDPDWLIKDYPLMAEITSAYFALRYHNKFLTRVEAKHEPIVRLEDINRSIRLRTPFFKRLMEYLTGVEWSLEYIDHIRENWTPAYLYYNSIEWENEDKTGRVTAVVTKQREYRTYLVRDNWMDDIEPAVAYYFKNEYEWKAYHKWHDEIDRREGYNQRAFGSIEDDWEFRGAFPWGDVYDE